MQTPERLQEIQELVKNTPTKEKAGGKRPSLSKIASPSKKPRDNLSPATRRRLACADDILAQAQTVHAHNASLILTGAVSKQFSLTPLFLTRVCSQQTKKNKSTFAALKSEIEVIEIKPGTATEALTKLEAVSEDLLKSEKALSDEKDRLAAGIEYNKKVFARQKTAIQEKYSKKVSARPALCLYPLTHSTFQMEEHTGRRSQRGQCEDK
jgi:hypothetical protein